MGFLTNAFSLLARLFLATLFLVEGYGKIGGYDDVLAYMEAHRVPGALLPLVILTEIAGGLLVATGCVTRIIALMMAGFALVTALVFHTDFADPDQLVHFLKNVAIAGGFFSLVAWGAGDWSIDAVLLRGWRRGHGS